MYTDPDGTINVAVNWKNIDGFAQGLTTFAVGASGAATAANNSIVQQTGHNFSGFGNVNWGQVGISSLAGGAAGFFGGVGAHYEGKNNRSKSR